MRGRAGGCPFGRRKGPGYDQIAYIDMLFSEENYMSPYTPCNKIE
jgi:hypothetical protein